MSQTWECTFNILLFFVFEKRRYSITMISIAVEKSVLYRSCYATLVLFKFNLFKKYSTISFLHLKSFLLSVTAIFILRTWKISVTSSTQANKREYIKYVGEGTGGFYKWCFVTQRTIEVNISWPSYFLGKNFINFDCRIILG